MSKPDGELPPLTGKFFTSASIGCGSARGGIGSLEQHHKLLRLGLDDAGAHNGLLECSGAGSHGLRDCVQGGAHLGKRGLDR